MIDFIHYYWDDEQRREEMRIYLTEISGGRKVETFEDAKAVAESFKFKARPKEIADDPKRLSKLFGVTIVYDKNKLPELTPEGTRGLQGSFELRSYRPEGVLINEASIIFVPELRITETMQQLKSHGLGHIEIRLSEELEAGRMVNILERNK